MSRPSLCRTTGREHGCRTGCGSLRWMVDANPLFVLVHSPLLGPSAWAWVARELEQRGRSALVPSLLGVADESYRPWREVSEAVDAASTQPAETVVLVAHSGAGALLPAIAGSFSEDVAALVFVDAFLPPATGTARLIPAEFVDQLRELATDALLPPWSSWFGEEVMRDLVPDGARRARVEHDMPACPSRFSRARCPYPTGGSDAPARICSSPLSSTRQAPPTRWHAAGRWPKSRAASTLTSSAGRPPLPPRCSTLNARCWPARSHRPQPDDVRIAPP